MLERLVRDKHSSLFYMFVSDEHNKLQSIDLKCQFCETFIFDTDVVAK
jgi:hypothetical protein